MLLTPFHTGTKEEMKSLEKRFIEGDYTPFCSTPDDKTSKQKRSADDSKLNPPKKKQKKNKKKDEKPKKTTAPLPSGQLICIQPHSIERTRGEQVTPAAQGKDEYSVQYHTLLY